MSCLSGMSRECDFDIGKGLILPPWAVMIQYHSQLGSNVKQVSSGSAIKSDSPSGSIVKSDFPSGTNVKNDSSSGSTAKTESQTDAAINPQSVGGSIEQSPIAVLQKYPAPVTDPSSNILPATNLPISTIDNSSSTSPVAFTSKYFLLQIRLYT